MVAVGRVLLTANAQVDNVAETTHALQVVVEEEGCSAFQIPFLGQRNFRGACSNFYTPPRNAAIGMVAVETAGIIEIS